MAEGIRLIYCYSVTTTCKEETSTLADWNWMNEWMNLNVVDLLSGFRMKFRKQSGTHKDKSHEWHSPNPSTNQWGLENHFFRQGAQHFPKCPAAAPIKHWLLPLAQFSLLPRKLSIVAATSTTCYENRSFLCINSAWFKVYGGCIQLCLQ